MRAVLLGIYLTGVIVTFGHETARMGREGVLGSRPTGIEAVPGMVVGALWPIYWPLRISYLAFAG